MGASERPERIRTLLPSVDAYYRGLPDGWRSYPTCLADASLLRGLRAAGSLDGLDSLPSELAAYLDPAPTGWIPEVVHVAVMLAVRDQRFAGAGGEDAFIAWLHRLNRDVLPDRSHVGPEAAVHELPTIWSCLHVGTTVEVREVRPGSALLAAAYPEPLFPALANRWRRDAIVGYLVRAGAVQPRATELGRVEGATHISITWS